MVISFFKHLKIGRDYDLKRLMRLLRISDPANLVMGIVGKKYPENKELFRQSRLDGVFDQMMAGKRMKLKTPVTWETQISLKGNKLRSLQVWIKCCDLSCSQLQIVVFEITYSS